MNSGRYSAGTLQVLTWGCQGCWLAELRSGDEGRHARGDVDAGWAAQGLWQCRVPP